MSAQNDDGAAQNDADSAQNDADSARNDKGAARSNGSRWLFYTLLAILAFIPLPLGSNRPMYWAFSEIFIFALFAVWVLTTPNVEHLKTPQLKAARWPIILLAAVCVWVFLQATGFTGFQPIDVHTTWEQLIKSFSLLCIFVLTLALVNSRPRIRMLAWTLLLSGTFQAVYGTLNAIAEQQTATGTFINRNHLAGYLEMTLAVGLGLLIADLSQGTTTTWRQSLRRWINTLLGPKARVRICLALMVVGLILTQSRMGNAAFFTAMMIAGIVGLIIFRRSSRAVILLFSSLIIIDTFLMGAFFGIDKLQERIEQTDLESDVRVYGNKLALEFIANTFSLGEERTAPPAGGIDKTPATPAGEKEQQEERQASPREQPAPPAVPQLPAFSLPASAIVLGTGAGSYYTFFPLYRDENVSQQNVHAHNDFFEFGLEFGLIGSTLLMGLIALTMATAIRAQTSRHSRLMQAMGFAGMMAIFSLMIHSFTDFNLQIHANAVTYLAILALPWIAISTNRNGG